MFEFIRQSATYALNHWRGKHSLARAILINTLAPWVAIFATSRLLAIVNPVALNWVYLAYYWPVGILFIAAVSWHCVGIVRSAWLERSLNQRNWRHAGIAVCTVFVTFTVLNEVYARRVAALFGHGGNDVYLYDTTPDADKDKFEIATLDGGEISLTGVISDQSLSALEAVLSNAPNARTLKLYSGGGHVRPAMRMGRLVEKHSLDTYVDWECSSACVDVFLAGERKIAAPEALLGMHGMSCRKWFQPNAPCAELINVNAEYYRARGVSDAFIERTFTTANNEIWAPNLQQLIEANVVSHVKINDKIIDGAQFCRSHDCETSPTYDE